MHVVRCPVVPGALLIQGKVTNLETVLTGSLKVVEEELKVTHVDLDTAKKDVALLAQQLQGKDDEILAREQVSTDLKVSITARHNQLWTVNSKNLLPMLKLRRTRRHRWATRTVLFTTPFFSLNPHGIPPARAQTGWYAFDSLIYKSSTAL